MQMGGPRAKIVGCTEEAFKREGLACVRVCVGGVGVGVCTLGGALFPFAPGAAVFMCVCVCVHTHVRAHAHAEAQAHVGTPSSSWLS